MTRKLLFVSLSFFAMAQAVPSVLADTPVPAYHLIKKVTLPAEGGWDYLLMDSASRQLYIAQSTHVMVVNVDTGKVVGDIPDLNGVHGVALDPKSNQGFTSNGRSNSVTVFNLKTFQKITDIPVDEGPDAILFDPATKRVFTFNGRAQTSTVIDVTTDKVIGTISLPGRPEFAVSDGKGHIYNNIEDKSEIADINARTMKVEHVWSIAPGEGPSGLNMDRKTRRLFSVCDTKMIVMDADTGKVIATPTIGQGPDACGFDAKYQLAFSPNGQDGTLTLVKEFSPTRFEPVGTVTTQVGARTMAYDDKTHCVLTVTATPMAAVTGDQPRRRRYEPGSFVLLEYGP